MNYFKAREDFLNVFIRSAVGTHQPQVRFDGRFVRVADPREMEDLPPSRPGVHPLRVPRLTDGQRRVDVDQQKPVGTDPFLHPAPAGFVGADDRAEDDLPPPGRLQCDIGDPKKMGFPVGFGEAEILGEAGPDRVSVQQGNGPAPRLQLFLQDVGGRAFP